MISEKLIYDEEYNLLSLEAQSIFIRMLSVSDDYGVIPANEYTLDKLINTPLKIKPKLMTYVNEIIARKMGIIFNFDSKPYYMFKRESFDEINSYVIKNRTKSEYLKLNKDIMEDSSKLREITGNVSDNESYHIESKEIKIKDKSKEIKPEITGNDNFNLFWESYPRKTGKKPCEKTFNKMKWSPELFDSMMGYLKKQKEAGMLNNGQYTPHPATWLNQERWNDQIIIKGENNGTGKKSDGAKPEELARIFTDYIVETGQG